MEGSWRVTADLIGTKYAVYRHIDVNVTDHSGNREYATGFMESREEAAAIAKRLNAGQKKGAC